MQRLILIAALAAIALPLSAEEARTGSHIKQIERVVVTTASSAEAATPSRAQRKALQDLPALPVTVEVDEAVDAAPTQTEAQD